MNPLLFRFFVTDTPVPVVPVSLKVSDGEMLGELDGLQVLYAPGLSAGQVAFLWPHDGGVLFAADAASNTPGLRLLIDYEDLPLGKRTSARLANSRFDIACFGHGKAL